MRFNFWIAFRLLFSRQILYGSSAPLAFLGLVLGVAALVASMAVMSGYVETLKTAMTDITGDLQVVRRGKLAEDWSVFSNRIKEIEPRIESMMRFSNAEAVLAHKGRVSGILFQGIEEESLFKILNINNRVKQGKIQFDSDNISIGMGLAKKNNISVGEKIYLVVPLATPFDSSGFKRQAKEFTVTAIIDFGKNDWNERLVLGKLKSLQQLTQIGNRYTGSFKEKTPRHKVLGNIKGLIG